MRANLIRRSKAGLAAGVILGAMYIAAAAPAAQSVAVKETAFNIERALQRLPYYGVFDFLAFRADRGTVTLQGYAHQGSLKSDAGRAVTRVSGVDDVANNIELLPASQNDDRIRWATFYRIYTDDFLSRYAPGGAMSARYDLQQFRRFPGIADPLQLSDSHHRQETGGPCCWAWWTARPTKPWRIRAREVTGVFGVETSLLSARSTESPHLL